MRKYFFGLLAVALALTTVSFKTADKIKKEQTYDYYIFNPAGTTNVTTLKNSGNWSPSNSTTCPGSGFICKIRLVTGTNFTTYLNGITATSDFAPQLYAQKS